MQYEPLERRTQLAAQLTADLTTAPVSSKPGTVIEVAGHAFVQADVLTVPTQQATPATQRSVTEVLADGSTHALPRAAGVVRYDDALAWGDRLVLTALDAGGAKSLYVYRPSDASLKLVPASGNLVGRVDASGDHLVFATAASANGVRTLVETDLTAAGTRTHPTNFRGGFVTVVAGGDLFPRALRQRCEQRDVLAESCDGHFSAARRF